MLGIKKENKEIIFYIFVAYIFSLIVRYIWIHWASLNPQFFWNDQIMINTNDGYYFASGVQKVLYGMHESNPRVPSLFDYGVVFFTTLFVKVFHISLETAILYMSGFISSLIVIPLILLGRLYDVKIVGFLSALLGAIGWSYYNRTMFGYYDTDMFSVMAIMFVIYFLILSMEKLSLKNSLIASLFISIYPFLYDQGKSLIYAIGFLYIFYLWFFYRKERTFYQAVALISISMMFFLPIIIKVLMLGILYFVFYYKKISSQYEKFLAIVLFAIFLLFGNIFGLIFAKISGYLIKGTEKIGELNFFSVAQTVREANKIPFTLMANRISGHVIVFIISIVGYCILLLKKRSFIITLPLMGIGIFSLWGGLRFTVYAVPVAAFSFVYFFYFITSYYFKKDVYRNLFLMFIVVFSLYPNIVHILEYKVPTVFNRSEVIQLDKLKKIGNSKDYVIAWWDYGYPIWFYSDKNTLIDGGKHNHDNFIVSEILCTNSQLEAARLSRIAVENYIKTGYKIVSDNLFVNKDPNKFLESLKQQDYKFDFPKKSVDIYLYLPYRMLNIFSTIKLFSNINLLTGKAKSHPFFYKTSEFKNTNDRILLGNKIYIDKKRGKIIINDNAIPLKNFYVIKYLKNGKLLTQEQKLNKIGLSVIFLDSYGIFLVLSDEMLNSVYIQMFIFDNYDKNLFEPVIMSPWGKIYKVKI